MDDDIGWNDFQLRSYDAQIGRWVQLDPVDKFTSPYSGMSNDPMNNIDPDGADPLPVPFIWRGIEKAATAAIRSASFAGTAAALNVATKSATAVNAVKVASTGLSVAVRALNGAGTAVNTNVTTLPVYLQTLAPAKLDPRIGFNDGIRPDVLTETSILTINYIITVINVKKITITSTGRGPESQVNAMYADLADGSPTSYQPPGTRVQQVYYKLKAAGKSASEIKQAMLEQVFIEGASNVSKHCADPKDQNAIDFGVVSLTRDIGKAKMKELHALLTAMEASRELIKFLNPQNTNGGEAAYHIQIENRDAQVRTYRMNAFKQVAPWDFSNLRRKSWVLVP